MIVFNGIVFEEGGVYEDVGWCFWFWECVVGEVIDGFVYVVYFFNFEVLVFFCVFDYINFFVFCLYNLNYFIYGFLLGFLDDLNFLVFGDEEKFCFD